MRTLTVAVLGMVVAGCYSPYKVTNEFQNEKKNLVVVTKDTEVRSVMGTNGGGDIWELCELPAKKVLWYSHDDFQNCIVLTESHPLYVLLHHKQSRGAGPEIVNAVITGSSFGTAIAVSGGAKASASAGASATNIAIQTINKKK